MESTNPRARVQAGWAAPPAIGLPAPVSDACEEPWVEDAAAFDATLGNLVEQFAALPPATFGEPPTPSGELPMLGVPTRRWVVPAAALLSMLLGGAITLALLAGPGRLWERVFGGATTATAAPANTKDEAPKVDVTWSAPKPQTEALPPAAKQPEVVAVVLATGTAVAVVKAPPRRRQAARARAPRRAATKPAAKVRARTATTGEWKDPYE